MESPFEKLEEIAKRDRLGVFFGRLKKLKLKFLAQETESLLSTLIVFFCFF